MTEEAQPERKKKRRSKPLREYPANKLQDTLVIPKAIQEQGAGRPFNRLLLAQAIGRRPESSAFRTLISSCGKYGLTEGSYIAKEISLTPKGRAIVAPRDTGDYKRALLEAALEPEVFKNFYGFYDQHRFPEDSFAKNKLEQDFGVSYENSSECLEIIKANGYYVGIIQEISGSPYVSLAAGDVLSPITEPTVVEGMQPVPEVKEQKPVAAEEMKAMPKERKIFLGHGKNTKPREQLEKVLQQFKISYLVAVSEPNVGRPISQKVADIMKSCSVAILIFTADEEYKNQEGEPVWRPSENVIYELGAASVLYGNQIVIFKEEGLDLPTNFRDLGYITFEKDRLDAKGLDLIKELVGFGLVRVTV